MIQTGLCRTKKCQIALACLNCGIKKGRIVNMRRKCHGKVLACILLAASMMSGLTACADKPKNTDSGEIKSEVTAADQEGEGTDSESTQQEASGSESSAEYALTEENDR